MERKPDHCEEPEPPPPDGADTADSRGFKPGSWVIAAAVSATVLASVTWTTVLPWLGAPLDTTQLDAGQGLLDIVIQAVAAVVIVRGAMSQRGRSRVAWITFAAGAALGSLGTTVRVTAVLTDNAGLSSGAEAMWTTALGLTLAGLVLLPASPLRPRKVRMTDTGILIVAATSLVWILPAHSALEQQDFRVLQVATTVTLIVAIGILARCRPDIHGEIALTAGAISAVGIRLLVLPPPPSGYPVPVRLADAVTSAAFVVIIAAGMRLRGPRRPPSRRADEQVGLISLPEVATVLTLVVLAISSQLGGSLQVSVTLGGLVVALAFARLLQLSSEQRQLRRSLRHTAARLHHDARVDALTGFGNRLALEEHLRTIEASADGSEQTSVVVFFADIDHFKRYNDALGHAVGDSLLVEVARRMDATCEGRLFRAAGDEFVLVATGCSDSGAERLAELVVASVTPPVAVHGHELDVGLSVGWSLSEEDSQDATMDDLLQQADLALYEAKASGRGRHHRFSPELAEKAASLRRSRQGLEQALETGAVDVRFEPITRLDDRSIVGLVARPWWESAEFGTVGPDMIGELASGSGPLVAIADTLLDDVSRVLAATSDRPGVKPWVGFRLTRAQLLHPAAVATVVDRLHSDDIDASRVRIEVAEQVVVDSHVAVAIDLLRATGAELSVERFGAGPPSLLRLSAYPATSICIDSSFVGGIGRAGNDTIILSVLAALARELHLEMSADGVTTEAQVRELIDLGFTTARGPLFCTGCSFAELCVGHGAQGAMI